MMIEAGLPLFAALFLEAHAGLFALLTAGMLLHEFTAVWDVAYTVSQHARCPRVNSIPTVSWEKIHSISAQLWPASIPVNSARCRVSRPEKPHGSLRTQKPP